MATVAASPFHGSLGNNGDIKPCCSFWRESRERGLETRDALTTPASFILSKITDFPVDSSGTPATTEYGIDRSRASIYLEIAHSFRIDGDILRRGSPEPCSVLPFVGAMANWNKCTNFSECTRSILSDRSPSVGRASSSVSSIVSRSQGRMRRREENEDSFMDGNNGGFPKRVKDDSSEGTRKVRFACPYRKRDPQRYTIYGARASCAVRFWNTVSRVKEHLYRCHLAPLYCPKCLDLFKSDEELDLHRTLDICQKNPGRPPEGITQGVEEALRSRKKTHPGQTEKERWEEVYRILFPGEKVPSPYFEPIQEEAATTPVPELKVLDEYAQYSRKEMPRVLRELLTSELDASQSPDEAGLMQRLPHIIELCQERVLEDYKLHLGSDLTPTPLMSSSFLTESPRTLSFSEDWTPSSLTMPLPSHDSTDVCSEWPGLSYLPESQWQLTSLLETPQNWDPDSHLDEYLGFGHPT